MEILGHLGTKPGVKLGRVIEQSEDGELAPPRYYACIQLDTLTDEPGASFGKRWSATLNRIVREARLAVAPPPHGPRPKRYVRR